MIRLPRPPLALLAVAAATMLAAAARAQLQCSQVSSAGPAITDFGSAHDSLRGRTVLFGGLRLGFLRNETWEWNGSTWSQFTAANLPGPRGRPALAFDEARGRTVIFGGVTGSSIFLQDTWTYDGAAYQQQTPALSPSPRSGAAMAHDRGRQVVVLFGGFVPLGVDSAETWEWNGVSWTQVVPVTSPLPRGGHRMAYDAGRGTCVLFGGWSTPTNSTFNDTWQWNGTNWSPITSVFPPPNRCDQAMAFDEARRRIVIFGGLSTLSGPGPVMHGDFWVLGPAGWEFRVVPGLPSARSHALGAYDAANSEIVLHSGFNATTTFNQTYRVEPVQPATMVPYGAGCLGSVGVPALAADSLPWLGDYYQVTASNLPNSTIGFMTLGFSATSWNSQPVPVDLTSLGLPGCHAWLGVDHAMVFVAPNGTGSWGFQVCNCPAFVGFSYSLQAVVLDSGVTRPVAASLSNAIRATLGAW